MNTPRNDVTFLQCNICGHYFAIILDLGDNARCPECLNGVGDLINPTAELLNIAREILEELEKNNAR